MAIRARGLKFRQSRLMSKQKSKRTVVAVLSLTAMVDMFTVLVVFLLQNYQSTGEVLFIPKEVTLPKAERIKELKPAVIVTISNKEVLLDKTSVISFQKLKEQSDWMIGSLYTGVQKELKSAKDEYEKTIQKAIKNVVAREDTKQLDSLNWSKVTIQADKGIDFLTIKKVMYTVSEAGAGEINFAVTKEKIN